MHTNISSKGSCLAGHVHAYERSNPVYDYQLDDCGATHVTIGDGGNIEVRAELRKDAGACLLQGLVYAICQPPAGAVIICLTCGTLQGLYTSWVDDPPGSCPDPVSPCVTKQGGRFCPIQQPDWSAYRCTPGEAHAPPCCGCQPRIAASQSLPAACMLWQRTWRQAVFNAPCLMPEAADEVLRK